MNRSDLTQAQLKEHLNYDSETGVFTWIKVNSTRMKVGDIAGTLRKGYTDIMLFGVSHRSHRLAWLYVYGEHPTKLIDHINGITTDNRISNLREVSNAENMQNMRKLKTRFRSGLVGAYKCQYSDKWFSKIVHNGVTTHLGKFDSPQDAHEAYISAKRLIHPFSTI